ncbi:MAG TPA: diphthamide biosynthesis enzyme Dph2 [Methanomassiliicoccales archaeon]|nr:MAG: 2-(3-amino-3-carboxypropyl)histidine synthase [Methanomassiliicoccales archaeon PtaB.Bin215]HNU36166.1 diphthamide biosynthesis enzyme Dph2 [Methanomassiliicoccales archaeon]
MDLQIERAVSEVRSRKAKLVGLQMPEGLKTRARDLADHLEEATGCQVIILGDPCYGACDLRSLKGLDLLVHVGHAPIPDLTPEVPTVFLEVHMDFDPADALMKDLDKVKAKVGLVATAQHVHLLPSVQGALRSAGRTVLIGRGDARIASSGQVLGCNVTSALSVMGEVEQFIFLGSGYFHPLAVSLGTGLPVLCVDPYRGIVDDISGSKEKVIRQRYAAMSKAMAARDWLVLLCDKPGQRRYELAVRCRDMLRGKGMRANIVQLNEVRAEALLPYRAEAAVSTACPRLAIDDGPHYPIPLLTPWEMEMVLGFRSMDDYRFDQILEGETPD